MNLNKKINKILYLNKLKKLACQHHCDLYLVGGFLRDIYLKKPLKEDFDFTLAKNVLKFTKGFSGKIGARVVILDKVLRNVRVVLKKKKQVLHYDFSKFRGKNLVEDLERRDFTINTLAIKINDYPRVKLLDYLGAQKDLRRRLLRCASKYSLRDDPLRIMRAFSLQALYNLRIDIHTNQLIKKYRPLLAGVAQERIAEELFKIFSTDNSYRIIKSMDKLFIVEQIFPEIKPMKNLHQGRYHHLDVWNHSLETLRCFEKLVRKNLAKSEDIVSYLHQELAHKRKRIQLIKLACLLHDIGKPKAKIKKKKKTLFYGHEKIGADLTKGICQRLRLSFKEEEFVRKLVYFHLRPGYLADIKKPTRRAVYRYFRDTKDEAIGILITSLSDWRATRGPLTSPQRRRKHEKVIFTMMDEYFKKKKETPLKRLIDGYGLMAKFKLKPSPIIGKVLKHIEELQDLGKIKTKKEALNVAKKIIARSFK